MRLAKYLQISLLVSAILVAVLITLGIYTSSEGFYVSAIWLTMFFFVVSALAVLRGYNRIVRRQGTANERLAELRFLQERRYEQTRVRLDSLTEMLTSSMTQNHLPNSSAQSSAGRSRATLHGTEMHALSSRFKRSERRIMGRLEDELYAQDQNRRHLAELTSEIERLVDELNDDR